MPENKKNQHNDDPKEQRRRKHNRQPPGKADKKFEKEPEKPKVPEKSSPKVEEPPPEFYKNLKRETDVILKITEEVNNKYKKKEIQSNWAKYELPVESYEEIDQLESMGADFESLIQASLSVGGHFQFKHEKSWNVTSGPSPYDKYFEINMDNLSVALCTIPFYERNNIESSQFTETDVQTMNHRADKYKHKYYNDKKYITPEIDAANKVLQSLKDDDTKNLPDTDIKFLDKLENNSKIESKNNSNIPNTKVESEVSSVSEAENVLDRKSEIKEISEAIENELVITSEPNVIKNIKPIQEEDANNTSENTNTKSTVETSFDDLNISSKRNLKDDKILNELLDNKTEETIEADVGVENKLKKENESIKVETVPNKSKDPVIESPEDLEKWLDDFLDG